MSHRGWNFVIVAVLVLAPAVSRADFKIKTRSSVMGHSTESTVYIKGARERNESEAGTVTITQCDKGRMLIVNERNKTYMVMGLGAGGATPTGGRAPARMPDGAPHAGGVITITSNMTDTGERQKMFGYDARHLKSETSMEASPDACNPTNMHMQSDGWYADLSPQMSCAMTTGMRPMGMGARGGCMDRMVFRHTGSAKPGYPLKVTTTMQMPGGMNMTSTTEVVDLSTATLPESLFDAPEGYREIKIAGMEGGEEAPAAPEQSAAAAPGEPAAPATAAAPAAPAAPSVPAKQAGKLRIGVVMPVDQTNQSMPVNNLRVGMLGSFRMNYQVDAVPIDATAPEDVLNEARTKDCDYILTTNIAQLQDNPAATLPTHLAKTVIITGTGRYLGRVDFDLTKLGMRLPQLQTSEAARADDLAVNAVGASIDKELEAVVEELRNPHKPKPEPPARSVKKAVRRHK